ncbi:hypothetical protein BDE02_17G124000 [Populus trichocarpa]|nr:hypothetical protein BDE02_17G124000 [Populus trichocarpa]
MSKVRRNFKHPIPPSGNRFCLVTRSKNLRLIKYLTSLGSSSNPSLTTRACKFCNLKRDFGSLSISVFQPKWRYLKCFKAPILSGKASNSESSINSKDRKCLNSNKHFSKSVLHVGPTILSAKTIDRT